MDIFKILQEELQIGYKQVEAAVQLIDEGNTFRSLPVTAKRQPAL